MSAVLALYRTYFGVAGTLAPGYAARAGARLFLTPAPRSGPSQWGDLAASAAPVSLSHNGIPLPAWSWGTGPRILLCHSWGGRASYLSRFIKPLVNGGYQVVAFDGPAHGRHPAKRTNLLEFSTLLVDIERELGGVHAMVGHSFGASSILYALRLGATPERVALIAPFANSDVNVARFAKTLRLDDRLHGAVRAQLLEFFADNAEGWHLGKVAADLTTPALLVHDENDDQIPYSESAELAAAWPGAKLVTTQGLGHWRIVKDEGVVRDVVTFVR
jgi:pimeloyl-ACP methyl ester carboxylesterase